MGLFLRKTLRVNRSPRVWVSGCLMDKDEDPRDLPGGPVVKTVCFHCKGHRINPWSGNKVLHATGHSQKLNKGKKR